MIYYSVPGNTDYVAEKIKQETEAVFIDPKERKNNEEEISDFCKSIGL